MDKLEKLHQSLQGQDPKPPLHLWNPPLNGDMDIVIRSDGEWVHDGEKIQRKSLVKLFSSILRRENDGEYYLLTPVEKWRIIVEFQAFVIIAAQIRNSNTDQQQIVVTTNIDEQWVVNEDHPIILLNNPAANEQLPCVQLDNNLYATINRAVYYQLAELVRETEGEYEVLSDGQWFKLG